MILHPRLSRLQQFIDLGADQRGHSRIAAHVAACTRCQSEVRFFAGLRAAARALPEAQSLPAGGFDRVRASIEAGDRLILPAAAPAAGEKRSTQRDARLAVGVIAAGIVLALAMLSQAGRVEAYEAEGVLVTRPHDPVPGAVIDVLYRPGALLARFDRLVLRASYRTAGGEARRAHPAIAVVDSLDRQPDGSFVGRFTLPRDVVYATLAVEDPSGEYVDANDGRLWELWTHDSLGRATFHALLERAADLRERNWSLSYEIARAAAREYPDSIQGWLEASLLERVILREAERDSVAQEQQRTFRRLHELYARRNNVSPATAADLWRFAWRLTDAPLRAGERSGDNPDRASTPMAFWRDVVLASSSDDPRVMAIRSIYNLVESLAEPLRGLAVADSLWLAFGPHPELIDEAQLLARRARRPELMRLWLRRAVQVGAVSPTTAGQRFLTIDGGRQEGIALLEAAAESLAGNDDSTRPLETPRSVHASRRASARAQTLASLAGGFLAAGDSTAAHRALLDAAATPWDASTLSEVAEGFLSVGDTTAATHVFARLAADPLQHGRFADSVRNRVGGVNPDIWMRLVASGQDEVRTQMDGIISRRPLRAEQLPVTRSDGRQEDLLKVTRGRIAVVSFWSPTCGYSLSELARLDSLQQRLDTLGIRHFAVTRAASGAAVNDVLREWKASRLTVTYDAMGSVTRAFNSFTTPEHYVLGPTGDVMFRARGSGNLERVLRTVKWLESQH